MSAFPPPDPLDIVLWFDPNGGYPCMVDAWNDMYFPDATYTLGAVLADAYKESKFNKPKVRWPWSTPEEIHYNRAVVAYYYGRTQW